MAHVAYARTLQDLYRSETVIMMTPQRVREDLVRSDSQEHPGRAHPDHLPADHEPHAARGDHRRSESLPRPSAARGSWRTSSSACAATSAVQTSCEAMRSGSPTCPSRPVTAMRVAERLAGLVHRREPAAIASSWRRAPASSSSRSSRTPVSASWSRRRRLEAYRRSARRPVAVPAGVEPGGASAARSCRCSGCRTPCARDRDQLQLLERQIAELTSPDPAPQSPCSTRRSGLVSGGSDTAAARGRPSRASQLELRLKPEHPDIGRMKR